MLDDDSFESLPLSSAADRLSRATLSRFWRALIFAWPGRQDRDTCALDADAVPHDQRVSIDRSNTKAAGVEFKVGGGTLIRPQAETAIATDGLLSRLKRRQIFRVGFLAATLLALAELGGAFPLFFRVIKIEGLGAKVPAGSKADILARFQATNDEPILNQEGRFFLIHGPSAIAAAYRKCVHLGCTVPWSKAEDQFHCPCHGSLYEKRTALMTHNPAPYGLDLFHITEMNGVLVVDTNPLNVMKRLDNKWHPEHVEIADS